MPQYSDRTVPYFEEAASAFENTNPDTDVQIESVPWDALIDKLYIDADSKNTADIAIVDTSWLYDLKARNLVATLEPFMDEEFRSRFFEQFLTVGMLDDSIYGLPFAASIRTLYYNKDLFKRSGVESVPETWEEMIEAATKVSRLDENTWGFGIPADRYEIDVYFYYALWALGGDIIEQDGTSGLDTDAAYNAAALYRFMIDSDITQPGVTTYDREAVQELFKQGRLGMMFTAPFLLRQIRNETPDLAYGVSPIPKGYDGRRSTYGVADSLVIFEPSTVKDTAWRFINMLYSAQWRKKFSVEEGFLPVSKQIAAIREFADDADLNVFTAQMPFTRFTPVVRSWESISSLTGDTLQRIYLGEANIKDALNDAALRINRLLGH